MCGREGADIIRGGGVCVDIIMAKNDVFQVSCYM